MQNFNVMMELDNVAMIKDLVSQDLGVSIIAKSACREEERAGRTVYEDYLDGECNPVKMESGPDSAE